jgi:hypothetical protein
LPDKKTALYVKGGYSRIPRYVKKSNDYLPRTILETSRLKMFTDFYKQRGGLLKTLQDADPNITSWQASRTLSQRRRIYSRFLSSKHTLDRGTGALLELYTQQGSGCQS